MCKWSISSWKDVQCYWQLEKCQLKQWHSITYSLVLVKRLTIPDVNQNTEQLELLYSAYRNRKWSQNYGEQKIKGEHAVWLFM